MDVRTGERIATSASGLLAMTEGTGEPRPAAIGRGPSSVACGDTFPRGEGKDGGDPGGR